MLSDGFFKFPNHHAGPKKTGVTMFLIGVHVILIGQSRKRHAGSITFENGGTDTVDGWARQPGTVQIDIAAPERIFYRVLYYFIGGAVDYYDIAFFRLYNFL